MQNRFPLYSADNQLKDWISLQRVHRLIALGRVTAVRSRDGVVRRVIERRAPNDPKPIQLANYLGTPYSYREHLDNGHIAWSLKKLGTGDELRSLFLKVVSDCLVGAK